MRDITHDDLTHPKENLVIETEHVRIGDYAPACLGCKVQLQFSDDATEEIAFMRIAEVTQSVFSCPDCGCRMVIFPKGKVPHTSSEHELVVGPPAEGFFIALAPTEIP